MGDLYTVVRIRTRDRKGGNTMNLRQLFLIVITCSIVLAITWIPLGYALDWIMGSDLRLGWRLWSVFWGFVLTFMWPSGQEPLENPQMVVGKWGMCGGAYAIGAVAGIFTQVILVGVGIFVFHLFWEKLGRRR